MLNYVNRVQVGLASGADNGVTTLAGLGRGDMLVLDSEMTPIVAAPADNAGPRKSFYVALGTGNAAAPFILSAPIFGDNVVSALNQAARAADDQVTTVGPIAAAAADVDYQLIIAFKDRQRLIANRQTRIVCDYTAIASDTEYEVASALAGQAQFSAPYSDPYGIRIDVTGVTGTITVADNLATVTTDSKVVTFAVAAEHNTGTLIAVGDVLAFENISYKVTKVAGLVLTLDRAYQGTSGTVAAIDIDVIKSVTAAELTITGVESPYQNADIDVYEKPVFEVGGSASIGVVTDVAVADLGEGQYRQIKKMEFDVQGYLGNANLVQWPIDSFDYHSVEGVSYNTVQIISKDKHVGDLQGAMESPVGLTLAFSTTSAAQETDITAIIDPLIPGFSI